MRRYLPGRAELAMFAVLSVICAGIVAGIGAHDAGLSLLSFPLFIFGGVLGLWKSGRLRGVDD
ncbi:hypothetical protein [Fontivita pretiosa]|uniref:hypothetical protein n=1 Tax=Fontivita pretiosa TaxID=2989684 RepID=UPI003D163E7A